MSTEPSIPGLKYGSPPRINAVDAVIETVDHPPHYKLGGIEAIDVIEAWGLGFCLGNAVKYVSRAGRKPGVDPVEDLKKARWYLEREIERRTKERT